MEMEQKNKAVRLDENPMGNEEQVKVDDVDGGDEIDENELSDMDQLPNEILMKVLDYLDEQQLVKCRLVNSHWNEICCVLLQDKIKHDTESILVVQLKTAPEQNNMECTTGITKPVADFLNCFALSEVEKSSGRRRPFPFSRFQIEDLEYMDLAQMGEFVSTFGPHMKTVCVEMNFKFEIANFEKLWKLLLDFANIQHFEIAGDCSLGNVNLFYPDVKTLDSNDTFLKNLKVFGTSSHHFGPLKDFLKVLADKTPSVKIWSSSPRFCSKGLKGPEVLQQLKKAHLLKKLRITSDSRSDLSPADLMKDLQLDNLFVECYLPPDYVESEKSVANYIYHGLKSSQMTLSSLELWHLDSAALKLCIKDLKSLPNLRQLQILIDHPTIELEYMLQKFSQLCPNLTNLILRGLKGNFCNVVKILWTGFQKLKFLKLNMQFNWADTNVDSLALDSAFSGYSQESIERIQTKLELEEGIFLEEARRGEEQKSSILDLKDLSRLDFDFFMGKRTDEMKKKEEELRNFVFIKILPKRIRENPASISYRYDDSE